MTVVERGLAFALALYANGALVAAEADSAAIYAGEGERYFRQGEFKKAAREWEQAVKARAGNPDYWDLLGRAYERQAELSSFPFRLTAKARTSFVRALELRPDHPGALADLIELETQPIGLCEGSLDQVAPLVERLGAVNPEAALRARDALSDARRNAARPGQRSLCGPVKLSRAVMDRILRSPAVPKQMEKRPAETEISASAPGQLQGSK